MRGLVDLHCHVLPGIDDGARTIKNTKELMEMSIDKGINNIVFTPHFYPERISVADFIKNRNQAVEQIRNIAKDLGICFRVGAEIQFTPVLASFPLEELAFSDTNYLLLELLVLYQPDDVEGLIHRVCDAGYIPILAHVERFSYIRDNPILLYQWVKAGALAQVNAGWIINHPKEIKRLKQYYRWNLIHVMASDMHSVSRRPQNLTDAYQMLSPEIASDFQINAKAIFEGNIVKAKTPIKPKKRWGRWR